MSERTVRRLGAGRLLAVIALVALPGIVFLLPTVASGGAAPQVGAPPSSRLVHVGQGLYEERCSTCHGTRGEGAPQGPPIVGLGPAMYDFMMSTGRMPLDRSFQCPGCSTAEFLQRIQSNRRPPVLSPHQIEAITAYLVSLGPGGVAIPSIDVGAGNISDGQAAYQSNCAPCHGTSGNGGAVGPQVAPPLHQATDVQVGEAIRIGPGTMPVFDPGTIDQRTLDSLVRYVAYLRHPDDRGGASLNHVGPLIEGLVGIMVGLGLAVIVTRYIGTRS